MAKTNDFFLLRCLTTPTEVGVAIKCYQIESGFPYILCIFMKLWEYPLFQGFPIILPFYCWPKKGLKKVKDRCLRAKWWPMSFVFLFFIKQTRALCGTDLHENPHLREPALFEIIEYTLVIICKLQNGIIVFFKKKNNLLHVTSILLLMSYNCVFVTWEPSITSVTFSKFINLSNSIIQEVNISFQSTIFDKISWNKIWKSLLCNAVILLIFMH